MKPKILYCNLDKIWIDELVDILTPLDESDYFLQETIDKPNKPAKLTKQKQNIPFWANDYRRK